MLKITGTVEGEEQLIRGFERFTAGVTDLSPAFEEIGIDVREMLVEQFAHEGFGGWPPLTAAYAARKRRIYGDKTILRASDKMFLSLTSKDADGNITEIHPLGAFYGTSVRSDRGYPYPRAHQTGTPNMAQRKIVALTEENKRRITRRVQQHLVGAARNAGFATQQALI